MLLPWLGITKLTRSNIPQQHPLIHSPGSDQTPIVVEGDRQQAGYSIQSERGIRGWCVTQAGNSYLWSGVRRQDPQDAHCIVDRLQPLFSLLVSLESDLAECLQGDEPGHIQDHDLSVAGTPGESSTIAAKRETKYLIRIQIVFSNLLRAHGVASVADIKIGL